MDLWQQIGCKMAKCKLCGRNYTGKMSLGRCKVCAEAEYRFQQGAMTSSGYDAWAEGWIPQRILKKIRSGN